MVGRFPPPYDGQALATARCASLLSTTHDVHRFNTEPGGGGQARTEPTFDVGRAVRFAKQRSELRDVLAAAPGAPVLWHSVSPTLLGHARDVAVTVPAFRPPRPVVAALHRATYERLFTSKLTRPTARLVDRRVTLWAVLNEDLRAALAPHVGADRVRVVPNTIAEALTCTPADIARKRADGPSAEGGRPLRLLFLSHMIREKGYADVLAAVARLTRDGVDVEADFVGAWPDAGTKEAFEREAAGLGARVRHHGPVYEPERIRAFHLAADLFVLPTYHPTEAQPLVLLEALSAGTPVVTTDRPTLRSLVGPDAAAFVPAQAPEAIAQAVRRLGDPERWARASAAARARYLDAFAPDAVAAQWNAVIAEAIRRS